MAQIDVSPSLLPACCADAHVTVAPTPRTLAEAAVSGVLWQATRRRFLLAVPEVARYYVADGRDILVEPDADADAARVAQFLRMTPLAALLFQRGLLALHAAAVAMPEGAVIIAGDSGVGKSTLAAALLAQGGRLLADDLTILATDAAGEPFVNPTFPEIALCPAACSLLGKGDAVQAGEGTARRVLPVPDEQWALSPCPIRAIYWITVYADPAPTESEIAGSNRFRALGNLTYNSRLADAVLDRRRFLQLTASLRTTPFRRVRRPKGRLNVGSILALMANA